MGPEFLSIFYVFFKDFMKTLSNFYNFLDIVRIKVTILVCISLFHNWKIVLSNGNWEFSIRQPLALEFFLNSFNLFRDKTYTVNLELKKI